MRLLVVMIRLVTVRLQSLMRRRRMCRSCRSVRHSLVIRSSRRLMTKRLIAV